MKPLHHARITAHRYGGEWQDWIVIHDWIDRSKAIFPRMQRRMFLHSDFGEWLTVKIHGEAQFWTYTCINWLRTLSYVCAWAKRYKDQRLLVIGVHTPEVAFEKDADNVHVLTVSK